MTPVPILALLGLGLGVAILAGRSLGPRETAPPLTLRERAIEAQRFSARTSQYARDLAAQWSTEDGARALKEK